MSFFDKFNKNSDNISLEDSVALNVRYIILNRHYHLVNKPASQEDYFSQMIQTYEPRLTNVRVICKNDSYGEMVVLVEGMLNDRPWGLEI